MRACHWIAALAVVAGCSKEDKGAGSGTAKTGEATADEENGARADLVASWKKEGMTPSELKAAEVSFGKNCKTGTVNDLDVLICEYADAKEAKAAEDSGNAWIGENMFGGSSQAHGSLLVVIADRKKADKNGKTTQKLMSLAPK
jgi:hypothetical protein